MPKIFGKEVPAFVLGVGTLVAGYLVYSVLNPADDAPKASAKRPANLLKTVGDSDYLQSDYTFKVDPLSDTVVPKDAFKPLVIKSTGGLSGIPSLDSYTYSGMAQLNGATFGLLENAQSGQGDFVQPGQRWHDQWLIVKVNGDELTAKNDNGDTITLEAGVSSAKTAAGTGPAAAGNPALNPMMVGAIGGPNDLSLQQDNSGNTGRRRGGGRRGNRGGGGGGGYGGGGGNYGGGGGE